MSYSDGGFLCRSQHILKKKKKYKRFLSIRKFQMKTTKMELEKQRMDKEYLFENNEQKLNCIIKWLMESEPKDRMSMMKMKEMMTDRVMFKEQEQQGTWFDELNLLTQFNENNIRQIPTVRPKLVKKTRG